MSYEPGSPDAERSYYDRRRWPDIHRRRFGEGLLLIFGLVLAALTLEGGVRLAVPATPSKGGYSPVRGRRSAEPRNAAGYRDVEHSRAKPPGVHRVLFVGDSFTYGAGVMFDDTYPERTARTLSLDRSEIWESVVLAVPGIGTEEEARIVEDEAFAYSPDLVVLGYVLNDAEPPDAAERRRATEWVGGEGPNPNPPWWQGSALLRFVAARLRATVENRRRIQNYLALYEDEAAGFRAVKRSLESIASLCRDRRVPLVMLVFPLFANRLDEGYPFESVHHKVAAACPKGATLVDLLPYYRGMDWRLLVAEGEQDEHPNELAHRIAAQALVAALETSLPPATTADRPNPVPSPSPTAR